MVEVLRRRPAVLARPGVTCEDGTPRQRRPGAERDLHEVAQAHDARRLELQVLGAEDHPVGGDDLGLLLEDEHDGTARAHDGERRVRGVEDQRATHGDSECSGARA